MMRKCARCLKRVPMHSAHEERMEEETHHVDVSRLGSSEKVLLDAETLQNAKPGEAWNGQARGEKSRPCQQRLEGPGRCATYTVLDGARHTPCGDARSTIKRSDVQGDTTSCAPGGHKSLIRARRSSCGLNRRFGAKKLFERRGRETCGLGRESCSASCL
eukprot:168455-Pleurochrysis_carterae.AAC.1